MATHSSILAWRISGTEEPGGLPSMGLHRVGHDWSDLAALISCFLIVFRTIFLDFCRKLIYCCINKFCSWTQFLSVCGQGRGWGGCSQTNEQFSDASKVSKNSIHFWPYLTGDWIRFHWKRAQFHHTLLHFRCQSRVQLVTCASDQLVINQRFLWPHPWVSLAC